jgi:hypothetical protein
VTDAYWRVVVDDRARKDLRRIDPQIASGSCVPSRDSPPAPSWLATSSD